MAASCTPWRRVPGARQKIARRCGDAEATMVALDNFANKSGGFTYDVKRGGKFVGRFSSRTLSAAKAGATRRLRTRRVQLGAPPLEHFRAIQRLFDQALAVRKDADRGRPDCMTRFTNAIKITHIAGKADAEAAAVERLGPDAKRQHHAIRQMKLNVVSRAVGCVDKR